MKKVEIFTVGGVLLFSFFFVSVKHVSAATTYYVCNNAATCNANSSDWVTGSDSNTCTSKGAACKTMHGVFNKMSGGDTVIIGDGIYSGTSNSVDNSTYPPYGSSSAWTVIKAEHDGAATFDGASFYMDYGSGNRNYYYQIEGVIWANASFWITYGNHVKLLRCGGYNAGSGNIEQFGAGRGASYVLFEDCYAWGEARYKFTSYQNSNVIFRRCVARMDKENAGGEPIAGMAMYSVTNGIIQNSIVIDSNVKSYWTNVYANGGCGCFYVPDTNMSAYDITIENSICLNSQLAGIQSDGHESSYSTYNVIAKNNVLWDVDQMNNSNWLNASRGTNPVWINNTFGVSDVGEAYLSTYASTGGSVTNNLFYSINTSNSLESHWDAYNTSHDYNTYYASTGLPTLSSHEYTNKNPIWNASTNPAGALKYITRIESGSNHSGIGSGGADIGANIVKKVGVSGTLWGETGYDTEQAENLWPFPNENVIKQKMASYSYQSLSGARGFAAPGNGLYGGPITLTSYIWEYLGNACPTGICTTTPDTTPPTSPTNLAANSTSQSSITVSWDPSTDDIGVTGYQVERCLGLSCSTFTQVGTPTASPFTDISLTASTGYSYHVRAVDAAGNVSGWSNVVSATTQGSPTFSSCSTVTPTNFTDPTFTGYGAPYDVFASNTPLISTQCSSTDTHTLTATLGIPGDTTRIVYTKGYYYDPGINDWTSFTGTCTGALNGEWCQGSVSASITDTDISTASAADPSYLVGFTCRSQNGSWKCGCRDTSCSNFYWQVQGAGM